jgi:hypothetical protein
MVDWHFDDERGITRLAYHSHKGRAKRNNIGFHFTYEQWREWWQTELDKIGPDAKRGKDAGRYVMCRYNDEGSYKIDNVYCGSLKHNANDKFIKRAGLVAIYK